MIAPRSQIVGIAGTNPAMTVGKTADASAARRPIFHNETWCFINRVTSAQSVKAMSAEGKPLHGAAKNSFMAKCMRAA
jgi:hypothetical protein